MVVRPRTFISYSHDSPVHEGKVLQISNRLREDGIDTVLDQYESFPPEGWELWQQRQIQVAAFVLVVCTETYCRRADAEEEPGKGLGAISESGFIRQLLYNAGGISAKFVPVLLTDADRAHIPLLLQRYKHFPLYTERGYKDVCSFLTGRPGVLKPVLGLSPQERKPDFRNRYWNIPARNPHFTGREAYLADLEKALARTGIAALTQPQAINGLGGIGKTQTAVEYAYRHRDQYEAVFWCGADSHDALVSGFAAIGTLLDLPGKGEEDASFTAEAVRRWLERHSDWLLILDNVNDLVDIRPFLPASGMGNILLTTRLQATGAVAQSVELEKMNPEEGALFLLRWAKAIAPNKALNDASDADRTLALDISAEVDGLPLALDQAGAYIQETPSTLAKYLRLYRTEGAALRNRRGKVATDHPSVTITFSNPGGLELYCSFRGMGGLAMKKYGKFIALIAIVIGTLVWLATASISDNKTYYKTITELGQMGDRAYGQRIRVGGDVEAGSIKRVGTEVQFVLMQDKVRLPVAYTGSDPLPDTFKDGAQALADGKLDKDGVFRTKAIQAKCASKYEAKVGNLAPGQAAPNINSGKGSI